MTGSAKPTCVRCGFDLVLEMDPAAPADDHAEVLLADPPFRLVCKTPDCAGRSTLR